MSTTIVFLYMACTFQFCTYIHRMPCVSSIYRHIYIYPRLYRNSICDASYRFDHCQSSRALLNWITWIQDHNLGKNVAGQETPYKTQIRNTTSHTYLTWCISSTLAAASAPPPFLIAAELFKKYQSPSSPGIAPGQPEILLVSKATSQCMQLVSSSSRPHGYGLLTIESWTSSLWTQPPQGRDPAM